MGPKLREWRSMASENLKPKIGSYVRAAETQLTTLFENIKADYDTFLSDEIDVLNNETNELYYKSYQENIDLGKKLAWLKNFKDNLEKLERG